MKYTFTEEEVLPQLVVNSLNGRKEHGKIEEHMSKAYAKHLEQMGPETWKAKE